MASKEEKQRKHKRKVNIEYGLLLRPLVILIVILFVFLIVCIVGCIHAGVSKATSGVLSALLNLSEDTWLAITATIIAAILSTICGVIAIMQSEQNRKQEERYHFPSVVLRKAIVELHFIHIEGYNADLVMDSRLRTQIEAHQGNKNDSQNLLRLDIKLEQVGDVFIEYMRLCKITFKLNGKEFSFSFEKENDSEEEDQTKCSKRDLDANSTSYTHHIVVDIWTGDFASDDEDGDEKAMFWKSMYKFAVQDGGERSLYGRLMAEILLEVRHMHSGDTTQLMKGHIIWEPQNAILKNAKAETDMADGTFLMMD